MQWSEIGVNMKKWIPALLILALVLHSDAGGCKVDVCNRQYQARNQQERMEQGPNFSYCKLLKEYTECMRSTARACRGNLPYHTHSNIILKLYEFNNCTEVIAMGDQGYVPPAVEPSTCLYNGPPTFAFCALFGDPHLRTLSGKFQTCRTMGAWPLINNKYLAIQVTNGAIGDGSATATTKVTVLVKGQTECSPQLTYEATKSYLADSFTNGARESGRERAAEVRVIMPDREVEIHLRYIATMIRVRRTGEHLSVAVKIPKPLTEEKSGYDSLQLCTSGCPNSELLSIKSVLSQRGTLMSRASAIKLCREYNITDFYLDACVFDLLSTGDSSFSQSAQNAQHDAVEMEPGIRFELNRRTNLRESDVNAAVDLHGPGRPWLLVLLVVCYLIR